MRTTVDLQCHVSIRLIALYIWAQCQLIKAYATKSWIESDLWVLISCEEFTELAVNYSAAYVMAIWLLVHN